MADLSDSDKTILLLVLLVVAVVTIYAEIRIRRIGVGKKIASSRVKKDQAYNALHTTKAIRNKLKIDRIDTSKADYMIQRAEESLNSGDPEACLDLCQRAREELIKGKKEESLPMNEPSEDSDFIRPIPVPQGSSQITRKVKDAPSSVDNLQLQAKFNLNAARDDLNGFMGDSKTRQKATLFIKEAERHLEQGENQKSLSDSFKARKLLSGEPLEESLGETSQPVPEEPGAGRELSRLETPVEEDWKPSAPIAGTCKKCGTAYDADDVFCHFCGSPLREMKCPHCGAELKGYEKFCRKCGKRVNN